MASTTYRHLNLLIDSNLYEALRRKSRKLDIPVSRIVRDVLAESLSLKDNNPKNQAALFEVSQK